MFMSSACRGDVDVVVNLKGADTVTENAVASFPKYVSVSQMDNSDLFVAMCTPGTFSSDHEGVCHDCTVCKANQYDKAPCIPVSDRACANCTVCAEHEYEICQCSLKTTQCVTGDRVCLKMTPTVVTLTIDLTTGGVLSTRQLTLIRTGMATGFADWLGLQFDVNPVTIELTDFVRVDQFNYKATFTFFEVYGQPTVNRIKTATNAFLQVGVAYTFGIGNRRRALLQASPFMSNLLVAKSVFTCNVNMTCSDPTYEFRLDSNESECTGLCYPPLCKPGYTGSMKNCNPCAPGTYKNESGYDACTECPAGYLSPPGSNSSDSCVAPTQTSSAEPSSTTSTGNLASTTAAASAPSQHQTTSSQPTTQTTSSLASSSTLSLASSSQTQTSSSGRPTTSSATSPPQPSQPPAPSSTPPPTQPAPQSTHLSGPPSMPSTPPPPSSAAPYLPPLTTQGAPSPPPSSSPPSPGGGAGSSGSTGSSNSGSSASSSSSSNNNNNPVVDTSNVNNANNAITINVPSQGSPPIFNRNVVTVVMPPGYESERDRTGYGHYAHYPPTDTGDYQDPFGGSLGVFLFVFVIFVLIIVGMSCMAFPMFDTRDPRNQDDSRAVIRYRLVRVHRDRNEADEEA